ncbi:hypothetical protein SAMN05444266_10568 [Chitinophaga jiangningensis]|uniref:DUF4397 domain-containing protein n=1 Tax=Chitinophaga jiangningensis TaxID=1419482 RepID=A0A1M7DNP7_9BACT|nr:hypothetical protein [Chitinophaga jiangningensis]SHL81100.1 hypothetical protein SAMN05444266_10568 [Chitinophaga jiangningensis]
MFLRPLAIFAVLFLLITGCRKGNDPEELYFGKIAFNAVQLPGTPKMDVKYDGRFLDSLVDISGKASVFQAGKTGKLSFYKAGTDSLIVDTLVTILPNTTQSFSVMASTTLGMAGFLTPSPVIQDTLSITLFLNLSPYYKYDVVDLQLSYLKKPGNIITDIALLKNVKNKSFYPQLLKLGQRDPNTGALSVNYVLTLKDPATGNVIPGPKTPYYFLMSNLSSSGNFIFNVNDKAGAMNTQIIRL